MNQVLQKKKDQWGESFFFDSEATPSELSSLDCMFHQSICDAHFPVAPGAA